MMYRKPLFAAALLGSAAVLGLNPVLAQTTPVPGQLVDGRIAFCKAELKITPGQETQWQPAATAMRQNANALDQAISSARQQRGTMDAVQRLTVREQFDKARTENDERLLSVFKPLYASLSPEQQQIANQLFVQHHEWHHRA